MIKGITREFEKFSISEVKKLLEEFQNLNTLQINYKNFYFLNKDETILLSTNSLIYRKEFGKLHKITAIDALRRYGINILLEVEEKCFCAL